MRYLVPGIPPACLSGEINGSSFGNDRPGSCFPALISFKKRNLNQQREEFTKTAVLSAGYTPERGVVLRNIAAGLLHINNSY